jgi:DNA-binding transcriptional LysR family regulator
MDLRWLEDVLILLEGVILTRAAQRRTITQPAFSRKFRRSAWLGQDILDRDVNRTLRIRESAPEKQETENKNDPTLEWLKNKMRLIEAEQKHLTVTAQHSLAVTFTDFITFVNSEIEPMTYRLKTANPDCISTLIRGDADIMLGFEGQVTKLPLTTHS